MYFNGIGGLMVFLGDFMECIPSGVIKHGWKILYQWRFQLGNSCCGLSIAMFDYQRVPTLFKACFGQGMPFFRPKIWPRMVPGTSGGWILKLPIYAGFCDMPSGVPLGQIRICEDFLGKE